MSCVISCSIHQLFPKNQNQTTMKTQIKLGNKVKCLITGFIGIAVARVEYINGCVQYGVKAPMAKGSVKLEDPYYIDAQQLQVIAGGVTVEARPTGGPSNDAPRGEYRG